MGTQVVSFAAAIIPIFNDDSSLCHSPPKLARGLDLSPENANKSPLRVAAAECVDGQQLVEAGHPNTSCLVQKIRGVDRCAGVRMPKGRGRVTEVESASIVSWTCQGDADK
jgi:hypothetical protein